MSKSRVSVLGLGIIGSIWAGHYRDEGVLAGCWNRTPKPDSEEKFFDVMRENVSWSGLSELKEPKIRNKDFSPQFSIRNMHKDMRLAVESCPLDLPTLPLVKDRLRIAEEAGYGDEDFISLIRALG